MGKFFTFNINKSALNKIKSTKNKKIRIFIKGGKCGGFKYGFTLVNKKKKRDTCIIKKNIIIFIDSISLQYLSGSFLIYVSSLKKSKFIIKNSKIKTTCNCGESYKLINY